MRLRPKVVVAAAIVMLCSGAAGYALARAGDGDAGSARTPAAMQTQMAMLDVADKQRRKGEDFLFSQAAAGGSLRGPDDQHLTLSLTGVDNWVTRFADRPARAAQTVDIRDFLARWRERFARTPPNAVLSYRAAGGAAPRDVVLELGNPRYDAAAHTATYSARRIELTADRLAGTKHPRTPIVYPTPRAFGAAALFVDSSGDEEYGTFANQFNSGLRLVWAPSPKSQCAGYGQDGSVDAGEQITLSYRSFSDGSCSVEPTYSRWQVYSTDPLLGNAWLGMVTFDSSSNWVSCTCLSCTEQADEYRRLVYITTIANGSTYPPFGDIDYDDNCN